jgi:hypothetical protein
MVYRSRVSTVSKPEITDSLGLGDRVARGSNGRTLRHSSKARRAGNPVSEMKNDANIAAAWFDFFAGLVTEMKGAARRVARHGSTPPARRWQRHLDSARANGTASFA